MPSVFSQVLAKSYWKYFKKAPPKDVSEDASMVFPKAPPMADYKAILMVESKAFRKDDPKDLLKDDSKASNQAVSNESPKYNSKDAPKVIPQAAPRILPRLPPSILPRPPPRMFLRQSPSLPPTLPHNFSHFVSLGLYQVYLLVFLQICPMFAQGCYQGFPQLCSKFSLLIYPIFSLKAVPNSSLILSCFYLSFPPKAYLKALLKAEPKYAPTYDSMVVPKADPTDTSKDISMDSYKASPEAPLKDMLKASSKDPPPG